MRLKTLLLSGSSMVKMENNYLLLFNRVDSMINIIIDTAQGKIIVISLLLFLLLIILSQLTQLLGESLHKEPGSHMEDLLYYL